MSLNTPNDLANALARDSISQGGNGVRFDRFAIQAVGMGENSRASLTDQRDYHAEVRRQITHEHLPNRVEGDASMRLSRLLRFLRGAPPREAHARQARYPAVALSSARVLWAQSVAALAPSSKNEPAAFCYFPPPLLNRITHVFQLRTKSQVARVATGRVVARVHNDCTGWHFTIFKSVGQSVGGPRRAIQTKHPVPAGIFGALVFPTGINRTPNNARRKFRRRDVTSHNRATRRRSPCRSHAAASGQRSVTGTPTRSETSCLIRFDF
jgi:hypothetical protein